MKFCINRNFVSFSVLLCQIVFLLTVGNVINVDDMMARLYSLVIIFHKVSEM